MPSVIIVGAQWGDEGKGKIIDLLTPYVKHIIRSQGGNNAGHTILIGEDEYKLHLIPSGILHPHTLCYIGAGTVIDPRVLANEIAMLESRGVQLKNRLFISPAAHTILPCHKQIDLLLEKEKGSRAIGTTGRGIGPCYVDKANRIGIRIGELNRPEICCEVLNAIEALKNKELQMFGDHNVCQWDEVKESFAKISLYVAPVERMIHQAVERDDNILLEGAQGTFLDITHGTYPYVTSSNTIAAGICTGAGIGPTDIYHTLGVIKAYTTRVGNGPLPSEEVNLAIDPTTSREIGTTTGRRRRIGWFDAVLANTAIRLNGLNSLAVTKIDILDQLPTIKICTGYRLNGDVIDYVPDLIDDFASVKPIYEEMPGWLCCTKGIRSLAQLPLKTRNYLNRIEELCGKPISIISTGPAREQTIILDSIFEAAPV